MLTKFPKKSKHELLILQQWDTSCIAIWQVNMSSVLRCALILIYSVFFEKYQGRTGRTLCDAYKIYNVEFALNTHNHGHLFLWKVCSQY